MTEQSTLLAQRTSDPVAWFSKLSRRDVLRVGGKGVNLGELTRAGLPVLPGFVLTADAYPDAMEEGGVRARLLEVVGASGRASVAVRSSATAGDTASTSFAGMNETFTNVPEAAGPVDRIVDSDHPGLR